MVSNHDLYLVLKEKYRCRDEGEEFIPNVEALEREKLKRKRATVAVIVILAVWLVLTVVAIVLSALGVFGGEGVEGVEGVAVFAEGAQMTDESLDVAVRNSAESDIPWGLLLGGSYFAGTWLLCWVGFPVGWNLYKDERKTAKTQALLILSFDEDGYVEQRVDSLSPKISTLIMSIIGGALTMCFSIIIAVVKIFSWKSELKLIDQILE